MSQTNNNITLVFLMWIPGGFNKFETFINSYIKYPAGIAHDFLIVFKNSNKTKEELQPYYELLRNNNINFKELFFDKGLDIDTYFFAAPKVTTEYVAFINNNSIILDKDWLLKLYNGFEYNNIGAVGCTASSQSLYNTVYADQKWYWEFDKKFIVNFRKYKMFIKAFFYWRFFIFKPFPNPHLRTNAFIMKREVFLKIKHNEITTKFQAFKFESGKKSLTNQLFNMGLEILIVGKDGCYYKPADWENSNTFLQNNQTNLLVADKQTINYDNENEIERKKLTKLSWGH